MVLFYPQADKEPFKESGGTPHSKLELAQKAIPKIINPFRLANETRATNCIGDGILRILWFVTR